MIGFTGLGAHRLSHSVPGRNRDQEVSPTGKESFPQQETPSSWKSLNLVNPDSDNGIPGQAYEPAHNQRSAGGNLSSANENINAFNVNYRW